MKTENKRKDLIQWRQEQILAAAKTHFAQKGYHNTKIDDISSELNIGKGTVYRYFKDKKRLFIAVLDYGMDELGRRMEQVVFPITDAVQWVETSIRTLFEFFDSDPEIIEISMQVRSEFREEYRKSFMATYGRYAPMTEEWLRRGIAQGIFREMDVPRTAKAMNDLLAGVVQSAYYGQRREKFMDSYDVVRKLLLGGVLKNPAAHINEGQS